MLTSDSNDLKRASPDLASDPDPLDDDNETCLDEEHVRVVEQAQHAADVALAQRGVLRVATLNVGQGLQRKHHKLLPWAASADIHVMAVQEAGLCVPSSFMRNCNFTMYMAPHAHAGCALFVADCVLPHVIRSHESTTGRANAVVMMAEATTTMVVNVYMPTNLDRVAEDSPAARECLAVYDEIFRWTSMLPDDAQIIIMGDFNETITKRDRSHFRRGVRPNRFVRQLADAGYIDAFRSCTANEADDGWTSFTPLPDGEAAAARLDQVWCSGFGSSVCSASVLPAPVRTSHRAIVVEMRSCIAVTDHHQHALRSLPDMRKATEQQRERSIHVMHEWALSSPICDQLRTAKSVADLDRATEVIIAAAHRACAVLPRTKAQPFMSNARLKLAKRCRHLLRLRTHLEQPAEQVDDAALPHLVRACGSDLEPIYSHLGIVIDDRSQWCAAVGRRLNQVRREERVEVERMKDEPREEDPWAKNPAAFVRQMLHGRRSGAIDSIIDPSDGCLKTKPADVTRVLHTHYARVFAATPRTAARPAWVDKMYAPRADIEPRWYSELMSEVTSEEIRQAVLSAEYVSAAGVDDVSAGVWKLLSKSDSVRGVLAAYVSAVLRVRRMPAIGKRSVIVPITKKANGGKTVGNVRPISLQCALTKLVTKILATRLGAILAKYRILHPAQEGFLPGGQSAACIDMLLDVVERNSECKQPLHVIFYDLMQAYDTMRHDDLLLALRRLRMPPEFIELIEDSMRELTSSVRCAYGTSAEFPVGRSVRQGDPLAPLLFVCFLDTLHCGMQHNPLYRGVCDGMQVAAHLARIASKGFADDTVAMSATMRGLRRIHHFACIWVRWHCMRFQFTKTVLISQDASGHVITNVHIRIDGHVLVAAASDAAVEYLGALLRLDLRGEAQASKIAQRIGHFCAAVVRHQLPVHRAIFAINNFLIPALAYGLAFVHPTAHQARGWDKQLARAVLNRCGDDLVRAMKPEALACITGLILPSHHERVIKVSEAYVRLNSGGASSMSARSRWLAPRSSQSSNRLLRVPATAASLDLEMTRTPRNSRLWREDAYAPPAGTSSFCVDGVQARFAPDLYGCWGANTRGWPTVLICTDGSLQGRGPLEAAGWAVFFLDDWFANHWATLPAEGMFAAGTLRGASYMHGRVASNFRASVFDAELEAIARALTSLPVTCKAIIYTDCASAIAAITRFGACSSVRAQLRTSGRQWLALISRLLDLRARAGATTSLEWVQAHSDLATSLHVGNRCADELAKRASSAAGHAPVGASFPLEQEDEWLSMYHCDGKVRQLVTGDPRAFCIDRSRARALDAWSSSRTQAAFCTPDVGYRELWDCICSHRAPLASEVLLFLTDTCHWRRHVDGAVTEVQCRLCNTICDLRHLLCCPALQRRRHDAALAAVDLFRDSRWPLSASLIGACDAWLAGGGRDVRSLLIRLGLASGDPLSVAALAASFGAFPSDVANEFQRRWHVLPGLLTQLRCALFVASSRAWRNVYRAP